MLRRLPPYLSLLLLTQCSKCKQDDPSPLSQLPPATQTGANTFGCLVNGKPWTPRGNDGTANYTLYYDRAYRGGNLGIRVYRLGNGFAQDMIFGGDSIAGTGNYSLVRLPRTVYFSNSEKPVTCRDYDGQSSRFCRGQLTITRLDLQAGIVSGTFAFTLYKPGCDSIRVTDGRFDRKL